MYPQTRRLHKRRIFLFFSYFLAGGFLYIAFLILQPKSKPVSPISQEKQPVPSQQVFTPTYSLFIPYWKLEKIDQVKLPTIPNTSPVPNTYVYFGVSPTLSGINRQDEGFRSIDKFKSLVPADSNKLLTLRMLNDSQNSSILNNKNSQTEIISQTIELAKNEGFNGIILDLEIKAIPTETVVSQTTQFVRKFSIATTSSRLEFNMTVYGDVFYRARPFDLKAIEPFVDKFYIMAYDYSKSFGTPGPNFPLSGKKTFGYDLQKLTVDLSFIPVQKQTYIFGMYGYDWLVDEKKRPIKPATALPLTTIKKKFLEKCSEKNCIVQRNGEAAEGEIDYVDSAAQYHIVWFEDETSASQKIDFLKTKGISNFSFWVWGYY